MTWGEYALSYGRVLYDGDEHFVKGGINLKLLQGINSIYIYGSDINYNFATDDTLDLMNSSMQYGHTENFEFNSDVFGYNFEGLQL